MRWSARRCALLAVIGAIACSSAPAPRLTGPEAAIAELRFRVAKDPADRAAHRELARLYLENGKPGAALRHWAAAGRRLPGPERREVALLYLRRARERLAHGDRFAYTDLEKVDQLGESALELDRELAERALYAAAEAAYRRADKRGRADGDALLRRIRGAFGPDPRQAAGDPGSAELGDLAAAAAWLAGANARRVARDLYLAWASRRGTDPAHRARLLELERWWRGSAAATPLGETALADPCAAAYHPGDLDCRRALESGPASAAAFARAGRLGWRLRGGRAAASLLPAALERWLGGDAAGWLGAVARRVDASSLDAAEIAAAPVWARPSLWRMLGDGGRATGALDAALASDEPIGPRGAAVLLVEAALAGAPLARIERLALGEIGWRALARVLRARSLLGQIEPSRERAHVAGARARWRREHHRALVDLGPLSALGSNLALSAIARLGRNAPALADIARARWRALGWQSGRRNGAVEVVALGGVDPARLAADVGAVDQVAALSAIARAHGRDPALGERLAREWMDGAISALIRGPALVELFARAGDPGRADRFAREVLSESPEHPDSLIAAAETAAALDDGRRAMVLMILAAARSGDAGATARRATRAFLDRGAVRAALEAGRWALPLTPPGDDVELLELLARAMLDLGRRADAVDALDRLEQRVGSRERIERILEAGGGAVAAEVPRPERTDPIEAAAWSSGHPETLAAALATGRAPAWIEARLASIALGAETPRARRAMRLWAAHLRSTRRSAKRSQRSLAIAEALDREAAGLAGWSPSSGDRSR